MNVSFKCICNAIFDEISAIRSSRSSMIHFSMPFNQLLPDFELVPTQFTTFTNSRGGHAHARF